jgi:hypothetical protein
MSKIVKSSVAAAAVVCLGANARANVQEFFASAYARPAEMVDGLHVGTRVEGSDIFTSARVVLAQNCLGGTVCGRPRVAH